MLHQWSLVLMSAFLPVREMNCHIFIFSEQKGWSALLFSIHVFSSCFEPGLQCFKAAESHSCADAVSQGWDRAGDVGFPMFLVGLPAVAGRSIVLKPWGTALPVLVWHWGCTRGCVWGLWAQLRASPDVGPGAYLDDSWDHHNFESFEC